MSSFSKQIWVPPFWIFPKFLAISPFGFSVTTYPHFLSQKASDSPKISPPLPVIKNDRSLKTLHTTDLSRGLLLSRVLENITGYIINIDDINYYKDENGKYDYDR